MRETAVTDEPCHEKTCLWGFRPGPTQTGLYSHRRWLKFSDLGRIVLHVFHNLCNKNKGADQIPYEPHSEKTGFLHMRKQRRRSAPLFSLHKQSDLVGNPEDRFSHNEAHIYTKSRFFMMQLKGFASYSRRNKVPI